MGQPIAVRGAWEQVASADLVHREVNVIAASGGSGPQALATLVKCEIAKWTPIINSANIKME